MNSLKATIRLVTRYLLLVTFFFASSCFGSQINATATLSRNRVTAGDVVQLDVKVTGAQQADVPPEIAAEGLQIKLTGQSSEVQMVNFNVSSSVIYSYIVVPLKTGSLTIPPVTVRAEGQIMKTAPLSLAVIGANKTSSPAIPQTSSLAPSSSVVPQRSNMNVDRDHLGFAEIVIPKRKFYVGEVVPVEIRFYVDAHYGFSTMGPPNFGGEGVLTDRFKDPEQNREERNNLIYNVATFRTLFAAVKPGVLELAPATLDIAVAIPEPVPAGMDTDFFSRVLGGRSPFVREQKMTLKTSATHCEVLPLPVEGRPTDFSGAIGEFKLEGSVTPQKVIQGDPVTLSLKLSGKGNFQALKGPQLTETQGWRTYPPADHFEAMDIFGWKGVKTFETTMIAQQPVTTTPGSSFSYFDPVAAKYVTLTTKPLPLEISSASPVASPTSITAPSTVVAAIPSPAQIPMTKERLQQKTEHEWSDLLHQQKWILSWLACFFGTLGLMGFLGARVYAQRARSPHEEEQKQFQQLLLELEKEDLNYKDFYNKAAKCAEYLINQNVSNVTELEEILKRCDEIKYGARKIFFKAQEQQRILELLKNTREQD